MRALSVHARIVLAVSGGPDSSALLCAVRCWQALTRSPDRSQLPCPPQVVVCSVDHGVRAAAADECADVARFCAREVTVEAAPGDGQPPAPVCPPLPHRTVQLPQLPTVSAADLREARYTALVAVAKSVGATAIMTAHHANDQAETVAMRIARGSGPDGLCGMWSATALLEPQQQTASSGAEDSRDRERVPSPALPLARRPD
ncbi:MAG: tRNA lysidine(34) synthetase, partial [Pseudomonadota bacterium]